MNQIKFKHKHSKSLCLFERFYFVRIPRYYHDLKTTQVILTVYGLFLNSPHLYCALRHRIRALRARAAAGRYTALITRQGSACPPIFQVAAFPHS